jgi:uncharacterized protein YprB with RNaseH-like and TPR domain
MVDYSRRCSLHCPLCKSKNISHNGSQLTELGRVLRFRCRDCGKTFRDYTGQFAPVPQRMGHLDIEASQLKADFGHIYSWAIKSHKEHQIFSDVLKVRSLDEEKRVVQSLLRTMRSFNILTTYNGTRFDIPFIRTRAMYHGLQFPEFGTIFHRDIYYVARGRLLTHNRKLETVARFLGIHGKTPLDPAIWVAASFGDKKAISYIFNHNLEDVKVLEKVYLALEPYMKPIWRSL